MCGIAGVLDPDWRGTESELDELARRMAGEVAHRGPDDDGVWSDPTPGIAFGHRRLSVVDLSPAGHQPMVSVDGRWVMSYNGECYNAEELRSALPDRGQYLRGHCDTEVVLEAIAAWGLLPTLQRLDAMFAIALWDRRKGVLHLVRDRLGEKPLYYAMAGRRFAFASGLRALAVAPWFEGQVDRSALSLFLRFNYVPAPATIYTGARKLAAGSMVSIGPAQWGWPDQVRWWDFDAVAGAATERRPRGSHVRVERDALEHIEELLTESVARRLVADVPIGTFLSGGIDSTLITALAQKACSGSVRTFTVGFSGIGEDESVHAAAIARYLGTDHMQMDLTPEDALRFVPDLHRWWDEPFADPSQLPTLLLCQRARRHVTVALSGDGGDEIFGGYRRYTAGAQVARWLLPVPAAIRKVGASLLETVPSSIWDRFGVATAARVHKLSATMGARTVSDLYLSLVSAWANDGVVSGLEEGPSQGLRPLTWAANAVDSMMAWDTMATLPDEMLVKVDRASMAVALEVRPPLLSHKVVEASWALPPTLRVQGRNGKVVLRRLLARHVPEHLVDRPKTGFDPPLSDWLRGPLRSWAEDLLSKDQLRLQGFLDPEPIRIRWRELLSGKPGRDYALWSVLMFQSWLDNPARLLLP